MIIFPTIHFQLKPRYIFLHIFLLPGWYVLHILPPQHEQRWWTIVCWNSNKINDDNNWYTSTEKNVHPVISYLFKLMLIIHPWRSLISDTFFLSAWLCDAIICEISWLCSHAITVVGLETFTHCLSLIRSYWRTPPTLKYPDGSITFLSMELKPFFKHIKGPQLRSLGVFTTWLFLDKCTSSSQSTAFDMI